MCVLIKLNTRNLLCMIHQVIILFRTYITTNIKIIDRNEYPKVFTDYHYNIVVW